MADGPYNNSVPYHRCRTGFSGGLLKHWINENLILFQENCITGARRIPENFVDLLIADPPFGIGETRQGSYNRDSSLVIPGYIEAPPDYYQFSVDWLSQAHRILKPNGSLYVVSGWTRLKELLSALEHVGFQVVNHLIWKYEFGVYTQRKYVTSHYHALFCTKSSDWTFNTNHRYQQSDRDRRGSLQYRDLEDVMIIPRDRRPGERKNGNKLPDALVEKFVVYSSNPGDLVVDLFMGNFTTAYVSRRLDRRVIGFELNPCAFGYHIPILRQYEATGYVPREEKRKPLTIWYEGSRGKVLLSEGPKENIERYFKTDEYYRL